MSGWQRWEWTIVQSTSPMMAFRPPAVRSTLPGLQTCQPMLAPRRNSWTRTVRQEALDAVLANLTQCTAGPDQRIFGKGGGSIKGGKVQRKAGATGSADGAFKCNLFLQLPATSSSSSLYVYRSKNLRQDWKKPNTMEATLTEAVKRKWKYATTPV